MNDKSWTHDKVIRRTTDGFALFMISKTVRDRGFAIKSWKAKEVWEWSHHEDMMQSFIQEIKALTTQGNASRVSQNMLQVVG